MNIEYLVQGHKVWSVHPGGQVREHPHVAAPQRPLGVHARPGPRNCFIPRKKKTFNLMLPNTDLFKSLFLQFLSV